MRIVNNAPVEIQYEAKTSEGSFSGSIQPCYWVNVPAGSDDNTVTLTVPTSIQISDVPKSGGAEIVVGIIGDPSCE